MTIDQLEIFGKKCSKFPKKYSYRELSNDVSSNSLQSLVLELGKGAEAATLLFVYWGFRAR